MKLIQSFLKLKGKDMWRQDNNFGRQRVQGCNTISICRCTELPETYVTRILCLAVIC